MNTSGPHQTPAFIEALVAGAGSCPLISAPAGQQRQMLARRSRCWPSGLSSSFSCVRLPQPTLNVSTTSLGVARLTWKRMLSWIFDTCRRPPGRSVSSRSPRSTRVFVVACTRANVRRGDKRHDGSGPWTSQAPGARGSRPPGSRPQASQARQGCPSQSSRDPAITTLGYLDPMLREVMDRLDVVQPVHACSKNFVH